MTEINPPQRKIIPLFEHFPRKEDRIAPENPASWPIYQRYAANELKNEDNVWPDDPQKRARTVHTIAALTAAGEYHQAKLLAYRVTLCSHEKPHPYTYFQELQVNYWLVYNSLIDSPPQSEIESVPSLAEVASQLSDKPPAALSDEEYKLKYDFASLYSFLLLYQGQFQTAGKHQQDILEKLLKRFGAHDPKVIEAQSRLANAHRLQYRDSEALQTAHQLSTDAANKLDDLPQYGPDHILTIHNRFYAALDRLAQGEATRELMAELGRIVIRQRKNYPQHPSTLLLLRDYAAAELRYVAETECWDRSYEKQIFQYRSHRHAREVVEKLRENGYYNYANDLSICHPEAIQAVQIEALCTLDLDVLKAAASAQRTTKITTAYHQFALEDINFTQDSLTSEIDRQAQTMPVAYKRKNNRTNLRIARRLVM